MTRVGDDTGVTREELELQLREASRQIETLRLALVSRAVIDQAKGVLMVQHGIDAEEAFARLSNVSQHTNVKVAVLAQAVLDVARNKEVESADVARTVRERLLAEG
mgnify:CR=1 FL=1